MWGMGSVFLFILEIFPINATPAALLTKQRRRPFCYESEKTGPNGGVGRIVCPTLNSLKFYLQ